jgi:hypothetical protein
MLVIIRAHSSSSLDQNCFREAFGQSSGVSVALPFDGSYDFFRAEVIGLPDGTTFGSV